MEYTSVKVIIPLYHEELSKSERISLMQCKKVLNRYPLCIIKPQNLFLQPEITEGMEIEEFEEKWFQSVCSYNNLMLSEIFYRKFTDCEYILIYQLDAFVFKDELEKFCALGYDYIGAPWLYGQFAYMNGKGRYYYVGNGGLSLRRVKSHLDVLQRYKIETGIMEDVFFSSRDELRVAPIEVALCFAFETNVRKCFARNNEQLPFGCHAWYKYDFKFYRKIIREAGYDTGGIVDEEWDQKKFNNLRDLSQLPEDGLKKTLKSLLLDIKDEIWIWGAGQIGKECGWQMLKNHISISGFIDNNIQLQGTKLFGVKIVSQQQYLHDRRGVPLIIAISCVPEEIESWLCLNDLQEGRDYISWKTLYKCLGDKLEIFK